MPDPIRIMIVDDNAQRSAALHGALAASGYDVVAATDPAAYLPARVAEAQPDVILIDIDSPSRDTLEQISDVNRQLPRPIVMFTRDTDQQTIAAAVRAGVCAYVVDGLSLSGIQPIIDTARAQFQAFHELRRELEKTRTDLNERKTIDRAKGVLMTHRGMSEPEAHSAIQKLAMDRKRRMGEVAAEILQMADQLAARPELSR
jgi:response regulator NasT